MTSSNGVLSSELQVRVSMSNVHNSGHFISHRLPLTIQPSPQSMPLDLWYFCIYICISSCFCTLSSLSSLHRLPLTMILKYIPSPSPQNMSILLPSVYFCIFLFLIRIIQHHVQSAEFWQFYLAANNPDITSKYSHSRFVFFAIYFF